MRAIGAGVGYGLDAHGRQRAILAHGRPDADDLGMTRARAGEFLRPRVLEAHRSAGGNGQVRAEVFKQHLLLAAKPAANARLDDPDAAQRQAQQRGNDAAHVERHLRARAHHQAVILIPVGKARMRLDRSLLHLVHPIFVFECPRGFSKGFLQIAVFDIDVM